MKRKDWYSRRGNEKNINFNQKTKTILYSFWTLKKAGLAGDKVYVNGRSIFTRKTKLGKNVRFNGMEISGNGNVIIGDNFHSGSECMIISSIHNYDTGKMIPYDNTSIDKDVVIKEDAYY